jgi:hypothetical protein
MSVSRHPVALQLERRVGKSTKLLATVMALPLIDGIFPALIIAGALGSAVGIIETGLLIFGGSATVAVILAEMEGTRREKVTSVLVIGVIILPVAGIEAVFAETLQSMLDFAVFQRFAGVVILAVAAKTASAKVGEYLPSPSIIIGLGLVASTNLSGAALVLEVNLITIARGLAAAGVGIVFAIVIAVFAPWLQTVVDIDRFRFGSSVALGMLAIDILGVLPTEAPVALGVLAVTAVFAYDPDSSIETPTPTDNVSDTKTPVSEASDTVEHVVSEDGRQSRASSQANSGTDASEPEYVFHEDDDSRAPWL